MHTDHRLIETRLDRALRERIRPAIYRASVPLDAEIWDVPGEPVAAAEALAATGYRPTRSGVAWGPPWGTSWLRLSGTIPEAWAGLTVEAVIDLSGDGRAPGFAAEGLVHDAQGVPIKGLHAQNSWVRVAAPARGGEAVTLYVEAAANPPIEGPLTLLGDPRTAPPEPLYRLGRMDLAVFDEPVWELVHDLEVLDGLQRTLSLDEPRRWNILLGVERALDVMDAIQTADSLGVAAWADPAREQLADLLAKPASASAHCISAVGNAHIDSAWLWPVRETKRKVARTVANATQLMADEPAFRFAMPQAQQLAWLRDTHPELYARVKARVASGQLVPVGGMWVEPDTNLVGGEALARQLIHGKRFFHDELGVETEEVWLPDSFGYTGALPQLILLSGSRWFLTQKMSWNRTNRFPHHSFLWEGIDGSRVFAHMPPVESYNALLTGAELAHASRTFAEKGRATRSLVPFGYGDGGGGPTRDMLARAARTADLEGSPRVSLQSPAEFFRAAEVELPDPPVWSGEMYGEFHRATYTSQARTKRGNRRSEHLLREAELWSTCAAVAGLADYPYDELDRIWKAVLLLQFHDILPGSSIAWVYQEAEATYDQVSSDLEELIDRAQRALAGEGSTAIVFNAAPHPRHGVAALGAACLAPRPASRTEVSRAADGSFVLANGLIQATLDPNGLISSLIDLEASRELIPPGAYANLLQLHPDRPVEFDAWDVDPFYRASRVDLPSRDDLTVGTEPSGAAAVRVMRRFGSSSVIQVIRLEPGERRLDLETEVDWHEHQRFLKVSFPFDLRSDRSASEIQFGHVYRPISENTSWDAARFEICAHRWIHVGEPAYGVAIVNDATYGHDVSRATRPDGSTTTTVRLSLLHGPRFPDPEADQGRHRFAYAIVPGDLVDAIREGYSLNLPERLVRGAAGVAPLVAVGDPAVVVEALKVADDRSGDVVVRLYESRGNRARTWLRPSWDLTRATITDLLERPLADAPSLQIQDGCIALALRPFQILTLRLRR